VNRTAALLAFILIAFNPLHILNSASAMTDVPHAFFVLASLYFVLKRSWVAAAIFAALAGLTRVESWMFIALIPLIQFYKERHVRLSAILILLIPPVFWFYVSWKAAGDWLACFKVRQQYHDWLLTQNPALGHFSLSGVLKDSAFLISSIDLAVLLLTLAAGWIVFRNLVSRTTSVTETENVGAILPSLVFFFAFFALLAVAYLTHQQPIIFPRYGLILFSLGLPVLAWIYFAISRRRPRWSRKLLISIVLLCGVNAGVQLTGAVGELNRYSAQRAVADYLRTHVNQDSNARIFCDEATVQVLSGIPTEKFLSSADAPKDVEGFLAFLREKRVEYLVHIKKVGSTPAKLFPDLDSSEPEPFELVMYSYSNFLHTHIRVFEVRSGAVAQP